jgi:chromosome segregation ATPase
MALALADYHKKSANLRSRMLKNEEQRIQLEQKLRSLSTLDSRLQQRQQIEHIQSYFTQLNQESHRAEQRNASLLNDITQAERNLDQLRIDVAHLIRLKHDYAQYLESNYPNSNRSHQQQNGKEIICT